MTKPSAWRSLHHCSSKSEKMMRAVDELITLLTKVCCPVSRRLSVMLEQGDLFPMSLDHSFQTSEKIRHLREAHEKSLNEIQELKRFQGSSFDTISRRRLIEDRDTILELTFKIQELHIEINYMNDSRDFQDAESIRSGQSHVSSQPVFSPPHPDPGGMLSRSLGMPSKNGPPSIGDTHGLSGNVFANPTASSSAPYPQESKPWISNVSEHTSPHVMSESQTPVQDQRCQSGPSAENSVIPWKENSSKNYGADQQRLQSSDPHFDKFTTPATFACWKIRFKDWGVYLFTISYGSYAVDERSGVGWFSGWSKIFVLCERNLNAQFWSTRCEDCFSTEQNHP